MSETVKYRDKIELRLALHVREETREKVMEDFDSALRAAKIEGVEMERRRLRKAIKERISLFGSMSDTEPDGFWHVRTQCLNTLLAEHFHADVVDAAKEEDEHANDR